MVIKEIWSFFYNVFQLYFCWFWLVFIYALLIVFDITQRNNQIHQCSFPICLIIPRLPAFNFLFLIHKVCFWHTLLSVLTTLLNKNWLEFSLYFFHLFFNWILIILCAKTFPSEFTQFLILYFLAKWHCTRITT